MESLFYKPENNELCLAGEESTLICVIRASLELKLGSTIFSVCEAVHTQSPSSAVHLG